MTAIAADSATWLSAIGTLGAVLIALFLQPGLRWWRRPVVVLEPNVSPFAVGGSTPGIRVYVRLLVRNTGRGPAQDVQAHLLECRPAAYLADRDDRLGQTKFLVPLRWAFTDDDTALVPPRAARFVDVMELRAEAPKLARLTTIPSPKEGRVLRSQEKPLELWLSVVGRELRPTVWHARVKHDGDWDGSWDTFAAYPLRHGRESPVDP
jgi:hypothetical protein